MGLVDVVPLPARLATLRARMQAKAEESGAAVRDWYRISATDDADTTEVAIYDEVSWFGVTAASFSDALRGVTTPKIILKISSPGGDVFDAMAIYNMLRAHSAYILTEVVGIAASAASVIAMAGDEVAVHDGGQIMIHDARGMVYGDPADVKEFLDLLERQSDNIARVYQGRAGGRADMWRSRMRAESWYFAEEAVKVGLADRVIRHVRQKGDSEPAMPAAAKAAKVFDLSLYRYAGREQAPAPDISLDGAATADVTSRVAVSSSSEVTPDAMKDAVKDAVAAGLRSSLDRTPTDVGGQLSVTLAAVRDAMREVVSDLPVTVDADGITAGVTAAFRAVLAEAGVIDTAVGPHEGAATEGVWDADAQLGRLSWPIPVATAKKVFAWYDSARVEDGKLPRDACKLPHHFVGEDGTPGAPSRNGISNALARLDQTDGPTDAERETIRRHLRAHLPSDGSDDKATADSAVQLDAPERADGDTDDWAAVVAHLTEPSADGWADAIAPLLEGA